MTESNFQPRLQQDGTLDPKPLERMGLDWLTSWMRERLSGSDPWFPIDRHSDEDPDMLIAGLLRSIGSGHPLSSLLGSAARRLLEEADSEAPYLRSLLRLCQQTALPATGPWFTTELERLAWQPKEFTSRWPMDNLGTEILFAALRQSPGWPGSPARPVWEVLLTRPESTTHALTALGTSLEQQASHLAVWWQACPREERELELSQFVFEALTDGERISRGILSQLPSLPLDLKEAIDRELRARGARPLFARNRWALLIGINKYPLLAPRGQLTGCINDVEVMSRTLQSKFAFPEEHVTILRDAEATRDGILAAMNGLVERVGKDDVVVFHYSGHGSRMRDREGDEPDGFDETIMPYDSGRGPYPNRDISDDELYLWLQKLTVTTPYVTLIFDCSHSGTIVRDAFGEEARWVSEDSRPVGELPSSPVLDHAQSLRESSRDVGPSGWLPLGERYVLIAACSGAESSYEVAVGELEVRHGALTYFLTQELVRVETGTTYRDVFEKVAPLVTSYYPSQHPQLEGARDREIFGIGTIEPMEFVPVLERKGDRVTLGAGGSYGLTAGSHWFVHPPGTKKTGEGEPLGKLTISKVGAVTSEAAIVEEGSPGAIMVGARAVESSHSLGSTRLPVEVTAPTGRSEVGELLERIDKSKFLRQAGDGETADARIYLLLPRIGAREGDPVPALGALREDTWAVVGPHGQLLMLPRGHDDHEAVKVIVQNLENRARFRHTSALANDHSPLAGKVDFKLLRRLKDGLWGDPDVDVDGEPVLFDGDEFILEITNRAPRPLYMYVLNLGSEGGVHQLYPVQGAQKAFAPSPRSALAPSLPPGRTFQVGIRSGEELEMSFPEVLLSSWHLLGTPSLEGRETMKLFATTQPADFKVLLQSGYLRGQADDSLTDLLMDIVEGGGLREVQQRSPEDDWTTVQRSFRLKLRKPVSDSLGEHSGH